MRAGTRQVAVQQTLQGRGACTPCPQVSAEVFSGCHAFETCFPAERGLPARRPCSTGSQFLTSLQGPDHAALAAERPAGLIVNVPAADLLAQLRAFNPFIHAVTHAVELIRFALHGRFEPIAALVVTATPALMLFLALWSYDPARPFAAARAESGGKRVALRWHKQGWRISRP